METPQSHVPPGVVRRGRPFVVLAALLVLIGAFPLTAAAHPSAAAGDGPTVVLVHGAFADASSWNGVVQLLQEEGIDVVAPGVPLRSIAHDSAYIASVVNQIDGPVLLVGHSYGGAIISNAATMAPNVVGLVFVSGYAPEEGERVSDLAARSKDSMLGTALVQKQYPTGQGSETATELFIDPAVFHEVFAADLPEEQAAVMAATQRPAAAASFDEPSGPVAWKTLPSWAVVGTGDKAAGADVVRFVAQRAGAEITELEGSHVIMVSQPRAVTDVILKALHTVC
jgi:pimeloyl-ACP methyl ester carboxylesterase